MSSGSEDNTDAGPQSKLAPHEYRKKPEEIGLAVR